jgi:hypothetical protein
MIKYEAYKDNTSIEFLLEVDALAYASAHDMQVRQIEEQVVIEPIVLTNADWLRFEQSLYVNTVIFGKALNSTGNGFALLTKVLTDSKTDFAHENALRLAIQLTMQGMQVAYTQGEIDYINAKLTENKFTIRI